MSLILKQTLFLGYTEFVMVPRQIPHFEYSSATNSDYYYKESECLCGSAYSQV